MRVQIEVSGIPGGRNFVVDGEHQFTELDDRIYAEVLVYPRTAVSELAKCAGVAFDEICFDLGVADVNGDALARCFMKCFLSQVFNSRQERLHP